jgi:hypothetical protein
MEELADQVLVLTAAESHLEQLTKIIPRDARRTLMDGFEPTGCCSFELGRCILNPEHLRRAPKLKIVLASCLPQARIGTIEPRQFNTGTMGRRISMIPSRRIEEMGNFFARICVARTSSWGGRYTPTGLSGGLTSVKTTPW